ncbi:nucleolysin TIA-1-like isoform X2 [Acanthaster planci]|uniref:Nucleolysin TIA-1-like isoform X2 n=1 Tax=Acanthaster planci TaxID=133434 RepID=A0A8B7XIL4_ACAPL|nr:nucleolysin TIA-1-like isoform X2 [Acanthaster planci]
MESYPEYHYHQHTNHHDNQETCGDSMQRTLYVGNLSRIVTEEFIVALFSEFGHCTCKMMNELRRNEGEGEQGGNDPYCFVEFSDHKHALNALVMNGRKLFDKDIKVNWATTPSAKKDTSVHRQIISGHHHIFVGDLDPSVETADLYNAFSVYGTISDTRVVRDPTKENRSKGYGFVSFEKEEEAKNAIKAMNGKFLGGKIIRTNWAVRKPSEQKIETKSHEEVYNQASVNNCTVYCGGIQNGMSEELLRQRFQEFGTIQEIRQFPEKGYAFIRFASHDEATAAIVGVHSQLVGNYKVKCSWGKETPSEPSAHVQQQQYAYQGFATYPQQAVQQTQQPSQPYVHYFNQQFPAGQQQQYLQMTPSTQATYYYNYPQASGMVMQGQYVQSQYPQGQTVQQTQYAQQTQPISALGQGMAPSRGLMTPNSSQGNYMHTGFPTQ